MDECLSSSIRNLSGMMRGGNLMFMKTQEACEVLEGLLERDKKNTILTEKEFLALNQLLYDAAVKLGYKVPDKLIKHTPRSKSFDKNP